MLAVAAGCGNGPGEGVGSSRNASAGPAAGATSPADTHAADARRAADLVARMSDEALVGQVLMPYAFGSSATEVSAGSAAGNRKIGGVDTPADLVKKYRLGGLILVAFSADDPTSGTNPTTNLDSVDQVHRLTGGLQQAAGAPAGLPLLIGTDQEYGVVTRIRSGIVSLPSGMALGAAGDPQLTRRAWAAAGSDLAALGINVDFAPDADVLGAGGSAVIGSRSFGGDPTRVSAQVDAAVRGLSDAGVLAVPKHFPGHGHTTGDSHAVLPVVTQTTSQLAAQDLPPFTTAIAAGVPMIMSGHLDVRSIDPGVPASFSAKILIDLLRHRLGFTGVVVTDALNMTPAELWAPGEAAVRALLAGNDLLLMPPDLSAAQKGLLDALHSGRLPRARLVEAVTRILTLKVGLSHRKRPPMSRLGDASRTAPATELAAAAVTVLRGSCRGALVSGPVSVTASGGRDQQRAWLTQALRDRGVPIGAGGSVIHLVGYGDAAGDLSGAATVTVAMDTPGILAQSPAKTLVATYSSTEPAMRALAAVLAGRAPAPGHSPIAVPGLPSSACG